MNSRTLLISILLLVLVGTGIVVLNQRSSETKTFDPSSEKVNTSTFSGLENQTTSSKKVSTPAELRFVYLTNHDPKRANKITDDIKSAIASSDEGAVLRAFHMAAYNRGFKNTEIQEAFRHFLNDAHTSVRFLAAKYLYLTGDRSGKDTLIDIMQSQSPLVSGGVDQRILAAQTLAKYREKGAASQIIDLYYKTSDGSLLSSLAILGVRPPGAEKFPYVGRENALTEYGLVEARDLVSKIQNTFETSNDNETRLGAARSLAQMTGEPKYLDYLAGIAQSAIADKLTPHDTRKAIKYLGSIDCPEAHAVLQAGLQSDNSEVVEYSAVNLLFNQSEGYDSVKQRLLHELDAANVKDFKLGEELKWHLAAVMADDSDISQAAKAYSERTQLFDWEYNVLERKSWPIYNWVDNYVVKLNRTTLIR